MCAVRVLSFRLSSLIALLMLCGSTPAWSTIVTEFGNSWTGALSAPNLISGPFVSSAPPGLVFTSAEMTLANGIPTAGTWFGPGGEIQLEFTNVVASDVNAFARQFAGLLHVTGGTGQFEHSTIEDGSFQAFFISSAPNGPVANATTVSFGRITFVPEPTIWLMLAGGLGLLGFMRMRRAAHSI
jgi:hypothetical protein